MKNECVPPVAAHFLCRCGTEVMLWYAAVAASPPSEEGAEGAPALTHRFNCTANIY